MMTDLLVPPALALIIGAIALAFAPNRLRSFVVLAAPLAALMLVWLAADGTWTVAGYAGYDLVLMRSDKLSRWFGTVFAIMAFAGGLYGLQRMSRTEACAAMVYAGGALGVVFAGDLLTLFVFWEMMAIASTVIVWSGGARSQAAGMRYLVVHLFGGVLLMVGIAGEASATGTLAFTAMTPDSLWHWLILAGFLLNAGAPPFSAWLPDAYPQATFSGMVVLSAFTTKTAVYVLLRGFPGTEILIWVGLYMVLYGIIYAILENDMRRILAYSIVNQVGFMLVGIGIGTELALNGAAAHAFAHIIYKALLLMSAGSVLYMTGKSKCTELGGLYRSMPLTTICGIVGALAISAFPLTSGFITKSMISSAAAYQGYMVVWLLLAAGSAGVFLHAGIKFPWFVFFQRDAGLQSADPPWNMRAAMIFFSFLCLLFGVAPDILYRWLPFNAVYVPYTADHVVSQLQLLLFSGLAFFMLLKMLQRTQTVTLDTDWFYRRLAPSVWSATSHAVQTSWRACSSIVSSGLETIRHGIERTARSGTLFGAQASGTMVMAAVIMLAIYILIELT